MPIGLIDSSWGGTIVEAWSPPEALAACDVTDNGIGEENNHNEYLWNGMIYPLLKMTIRFNRLLVSSVYSTFFLQGSCLVPGRAKCGLPWRVWRMEQGYL